MKLLPYSLALAALLFCTFGFTVLPIHSTEYDAYTEALNYPGQDAFTASFMKYVNGSYYTTTVTECYGGLHDNKFKPIKKSNYTQCVCTEKLEDFKGTASYSTADNRAVAYFYRGYKESELTEGEISWAMTLKWIREALGPSYIEKSTSDNFGGKEHRFYLPGSDTDDKKAYKVEIHMNRYAASKGGMSVSFSIEGTKKP